MADLPDDLLADLESDDESVASQGGPVAVKAENSHSAHGNAEKKSSGATGGDADSIASDPIAAAAPMLFTGRIASHMRRIAAFSGEAPKSEPGDESHSKAERTALHDRSDLGYSLAVDTNALATLVTDETASVFLLLRTLYRPRFPELESVAPMASDYSRAVLLIGESEDLTRVDYGSVFAPHTAMVVSLSASTSSGKPFAAANAAGGGGGERGRMCPEVQPQALSAEEAKSEAPLARSLRAAEVVRVLMDAHASLVAFVRSRMHEIAPNAAAIVGHASAAELLSAAGGIAKLASLPASTIATLGHKQPRGSELSFFVVRAAATGANGDTGVGSAIARSEPVAACAETDRVRCARVVAGRLALAARVDAAGGDPTGGTGRKYRQEIDEKTEKWRIPPPQRMRKPLKAPDAGAKRKRGGRKSRNLRARFAQTEMEKRAARVTFNGKVADDADDSDEETIAGKGAIGRTGGKFSGMSREGEGTKTQAKLAKKYKEILTNPGNSHASGTMTSLAFGSSQGIELGNPAAQAEAERDTRQKYFGAATPFTAK